MDYIRIVGPVVHGTARYAAAVRSIERPGLGVSQTKIEQGPATVESELEDGFALPHTVGLVVKAELEGCDAVVIDCMGDPGLTASRGAVSIPVLGPCECGMLLAVSLGYRLSVFGGVAAGAQSADV